MRPTVMLSAQQGFAARLLLRTDILPTLLAGGAKVVVLAPNHDEDYLSRELPDGVTLEPLRLGSTLPRPAKLWYLFVVLRGHVLAGGQRLGTIRHKLRRRRRGEVAGKGPWAAVVELGIGALCRLLWRSKALRRALVRLESSLFATDLHADVFERHRPDLVVCCSPGWFWQDAVILREAARHGAPTASLVLGWDNPTSKGYRGADPDLVVAWSDHMARQLAELHDMPADRIAVGGVPVWDPYVRPDGLPGREEFFSAIGLDPSRRTVVYATSTPRGYDRNLEMVQRLARAIEGAEFDGPCQLVVRLHPLLFGPGHESTLDAFTSFARDTPFVHLDTPRVRSRRLRFDLAASDQHRLGGLLKHCDVLVNVFSTTTLEAFLLDRPVVFVGAADGPGDPANPDPQTYSEYTHLKDLVEAGAVRVSRSPDELVAHVRTYLAHPELDREQRRHFALRECGPTDGHAGERTGRLLLRAAGGQPAGRCA